jgi:hypothetical protein
MLRNFYALVALALLPCAACTHQVQVTPNYSPQALTAQKLGKICPGGEAVAVSASNEAADVVSAGTTEAGVHTFNYRFDSDPSLVLARGLQEALRQGGCASGKDAPAKLKITLRFIEARGLSCGFVSCEGKGEAIVEATLLDRDGHTLQSDTFSPTATTGCGLAICNGKEAGELASEVLTKAITDTVAAFAKAITKQLATPTAPVAPATASVAPAS